MQFSCHGIRVQPFPPASENSSGVTKRRRKSFGSECLIQGRQQIRSSDVLAVPRQYVVYASGGSQGDVFSICRCFCGEQVAGDEKIGKPVGCSRSAKERQSFEQAKAVRCCRGIARPGLIKLQLADGEVELLATLLPLATRQLLSRLE